MLKIKIEVEEHDKKAMALEVELISQLILAGHTEGSGWQLEGAPEKEKGLVEIEEDEEEIENDEELGPF